METIQNIIIDNTLKRIGETQFADYLCHAYCYDGYCTFERNGQSFRFEAGDCLIIARRGDLVMNLKESEDFRVDVIYVTQKFIEMSTPQSNYGMRGQLFLFQNPIMKLTPEQQEVCRQNFEAVKRRLKQTDHHFRHDALMNAVECMIIDFFDFHSKLYPADKISSQQHQLMEEFMAMRKKVSGLPAAFWITRYTSLDISRLLRDRNLSFTDISEMFGFSSLSHFSRYVQTNLGAKPSDFRE